MKIPQQVHSENIKQYIAGYEDFIKVTKKELEDYGLAIHHTHNFYNCGKMLGTDKVYLCHIDKTDLHFVRWYLYNFHTLYPELNQYSGLNFMMEISFQEAFNKFPVDLKKYTLFNLHLLEY